MVDRRTFLKYGAVSTALTALGAVPGTGRPVVQPDTPPGDHPLDLGSEPVVEATIDDLRAGQADGRMTARSIAESYLERIRLLDRQGPALSAVIEVNPEALAIADALDEERRAGGPRGPLHGIPILIKDNIATADLMETTAGSLALVGAKVPRDSGVARRLREAGALILGKTNLSEWANFRSNRSSSGWSGRGGQTKNPYALDRNPCGSSSGSGVAVAASLCAAAIGTETNGSIVCPASANSVVGLKPTVGLVSRAGIVPISHSQDTAGPMARTVRDAAILLGALVGADPRDPLSEQAAPRGESDYTQYLVADGLRGARIGVARNFFDFHERVDQLMEEAITALRAAGAILVDPTNLELPPESREARFNVLLYEFKADLNAYLAELGGKAPVHSLAELIAFNEANRQREMPYFEQELLQAAQAKGPLTSEEYLEALALARRVTREEGIDKVMDEHRLDALIAPTGGPPWTIDLINGDHFGGGSSTPAAVAGYPNITVPAGYIYGLPVGLSFFGRAFSEPTLLRIAHGFEQATKLRRPPQYLPTADLSV
jgi:amidase